MSRKYYPAKRANGEILATPVINAYDDSECVKIMRQRYTVTNLKPGENARVQLSTGQIYSLQNKAGRVIGTFTQTAAPNDN